MPHCVIVGKTSTGKSTLAKTLARKYVDMGIPVLVLDPMKSVEWPKGHVTNDPYEFKEWLFKSRNCAAFVDECLTSLGRDAEHDCIATMGRHPGVKVHFISQRYVHLMPNIRTQCVEAYVFLQGRKDAAELAEEFSDDGMLEAAQLPIGTFLFKRLGHPIKKMRVF
jgi:GTPase SAR1 family protein